MKQAPPPKTQPPAALPADAAGKAAGKSAAKAANTSSPAPSLELSLTERRKFIRPLPVPLAEESDRDSAWATFQELSSDKPKT